MSEKPAGWYYVGGGRLRYRDDYGWTEYYLATTDPRAQSWPPPTPTTMLQQVREEERARAALQQKRRGFFGRRRRTVCLTVGVAQESANRLRKCRPRSRVPAMITIMTRCIRGLLSRRDRGATAVEYALIASLIAAVIAATVGAHRDEP